MLLVFVNYSLFEADPVPDLGLLHQRGALLGLHSKAIEVLRDEVDGALDSPIMLALSELIPLYPHPDIFILFMEEWAAVPHSADAPSELNPPANQTLLFGFLLYHLNTIRWKNPSLQ